MDQPIFLAGQSRNDCHSLWVCPFVPENKPGAGGMLAMQELISHPADGHTLLICTYFDPVNTLVYRSARYRVSDLCAGLLVDRYL